MDTLKLYEDLAETLAPEAARKIAGALGAVYEELRQSVTQADFADLKAVVAELAEAQSRTEERLSRLEQVVSNLAEAQSRTELRLHELAEAQQRTEQRLHELAEAQQRTEQRLHELAEAQQRTEQRVQELAEAQRRTEMEVTALVRGLKVTREMVAELSDSMGYGLENRAIARLPAILEADHGVRVEGRLVRRFVEYPEGGEDEVNILGEGRKGEVRVSIVGEAKVHLAKRHIDEFLRRIARLEQHGLLHPERFLLAVTHSVQPQVQRYADARDVVVVPSYLLES